MRLYGVRWSVLPVLSLLLLCLPGCWDYQKINERAQIIGIGVDPVQGRGDVLSYTLQVPVLQGGDESASSGGSSPGSSGVFGAFRNFTVQAGGLNEAITEAQTQYAKMFYTGSLQAIILNRQLTSTQVRNTVTEMMRTPFLDKLAWVVFTSQSAAEVLRAKASSAPADEVDRFMGISVKLHGLTERRRLWEFWRDLRSDGIDPHAGMIRSYSKGVQVYGMLTFHKARPAWELTPLQTTYYNFMDGRVQRMSMWVKDGPRAFEVQNVFSHSHISVSMQRDRPVVHVIIRVNAMIVQDETDGLKHLTGREIKRYEFAMADQITRDCSNLMQQFQRRQIDAFGFGQYVYIHRLKSQSYVEQKWPAAFAHAVQDIQSNVRLVQKGVLM